MWTAGRHAGWAVGILGGSHGVWWACREYARQGEVEFLLEPLPRDSLRDDLMDECDSEHGYRKPGVQDDDTGHDVSSEKPQLWGTTATNWELWRVRDARFRARGPHHQAVGPPSSFVGIARSTRPPGPSAACGGAADLFRWLRSRVRPTRRRRVRCNRPVLSSRATPGDDAVQGGSPLGDGRGWPMTGLGPEWGGSLLASPRGRGGGRWPRAGMAPRATSRPSAMGWKGIEARVRQPVCWLGDDRSSVLVGWGTDNVSCGAS